MAEASSELPAVDCNNPYHQKPHPSAGVGAGVAFPFPSAHHCFPFHPHQASSFHCLPRPPSNVPPTPSLLPPFYFPHDSQIRHLPADLPFFLGKCFSPTICHLPVQKPFQCRHCGAWNNTFFSPPALAPSLPPQNSTFSSQPVDSSIPPQSLKLSVEEPELQQNYDQNLQVDLDVVEEAEEGVEECMGEQDDDDEDPQFVLTNEWLEFFAKSEARRKEKKRQQKKDAKAARKAARLVNSQNKASADVSLSEDMVCAFETGSLPSSGAEFDADKLESVASSSAMSHTVQQSIDLQEFQDGLETHSGTEDSTL